MVDSSAYRYPFHLSICIPTYNRQELLRQTLGSLAWIQESGRKIEVVVSDNASQDETPSVAQEMGAKLPFFRYFRHPRTVGAENNMISVMRSAKGRYVIYLADDDLLDSSVLLREIDFLEQNRDIVASCSPLLNIDPETGQELASYDLKGKTFTFGRSDSMALFDFMLSHGIMAEIAIFRNDLLAKFWHGAHLATVAFFWPLHAISYGKVRFNENLYYKFYRIYNTDSRISVPPLNNVQVSSNYIISHLDQIRGGFEMALTLAMAHAGTMMLPGELQGRGRQLAEYMVNVLDNAAIVAYNNKRYIDAYELIQRNMPWKEPVRRLRVRQLGLEHTLPTMAAFQLIGEIFASFPEAQHLVLCEVDDPLGTQSRFQGLAPLMSTVIRSLPTALGADDRLLCLYLTDHEETRLQLFHAEIPIGKIFLRSEVVAMYRIQI